MFENDPCNEPVISLWNGIDLHWVETPCTVLFADKGSVSLVERTSALCTWH